MVRFSRKLQDTLSKIKDQNVLLQYLIEYYIGGTSIDECACLFNNSQQEIIDVLIAWGVYEHKICSKCKELKPFSLFYSNPSMGKNTNRSGVSCQCRECNSKNGKNYFNNNRDHKRTYDREYKRQPHVLEQRLEYQKEYYKDPENKKKAAIRSNNRYHGDIKIRLHTVVSVYINKCLIHGKNGVSINNILKFSMEDLKLHLESQFDKNMNWDNYGSYWEIDHIVPLTAFDFISYEDGDFEKCWSLKNLQPLEISLNRSKCDNIGIEWNNQELFEQFNLAK